MNRDLLHWWSGLRADMQAGRDRTSVLRILEREVKGLGYEHYAYGVRHAVPFTRPRTEIHGNYPKAWLAHYRAQNYAAIDPSFLNGRQNTGMMVWSDELFKQSRQLWSEARDHGLRVGAAMPYRLPSNVLSVLAVSRDQGPIGASEADHIELCLRLLIEQTTLRLNEVAPELLEPDQVALSSRECEILRWTADGKSSSEIALILDISFNTVNYHLKTIQKKFGAANKTLAAAYAAALGLL